MAKKERPKCDICGQTHWAGEPHRIDPALAADVIKKLELRIVELENQLAAKADVPVEAPLGLSDLTGISSATICQPFTSCYSSPHGFLEQQQNALANAQANLQGGATSGILCGFMGIGGLK